MPETEAHARATKKYHAKFDEVKFRVPKGEREAIQAYASSKGESLNQLLCRLVKEAMERDGVRTNSEE